VSVWIFNWVQGKVFFTLCRVVSLAAARLYPY